MKSVAAQYIFLVTTAIFIAFLAPLLTFLFMSAFSQSNIVDTSNWGLAIVPFTLFVFFVIALMTPFPFSIGFRAFFKNNSNHVNNTTSTLFLHLSAFGIILPMIATNFFMKIRYQYFLRSPRLEELYSQKVTETLQKQPEPASDFYVTLIKDSIIRGKYDNDIPDPRYQKKMSYYYTFEITNPSKNTISATIQPELIHKSEQREKTKEEKAMEISNPMYFGMFDSQTDTAFSGYDQNWNKLYNLSPGSNIISGVIDISNYNKNGSIEKLMSDPTKIVDEKIFLSIKVEVSGDNDQYSLYDDNRYLLSTTISDWQSHLIYVFNVI